MTVWRESCFRAWPELSWRKGCSSRLVVTAAVPLHRKSIPQTPVWWWCRRSRCSLTTGSPCFPRVTTCLLQATNVAGCGSIIWASELACLNNLATVGLMRVAGPEPEGGEISDDYLKADQSHRQGFWFAATKGRLSTLVPSQPNASVRKFKYSEEFSWLSFQTSKARTIYKYSF